MYENNILLYNKSIIIYQDFLSEIYSQAARIFPGIHLLEILFIQNKKAWFKIMFLMRWGI